MSSKEKDHVSENSLQPDSYVSKDMGDNETSNSNLDENNDSNEPLMDTVEEVVDSDSEVNHDEDTIQSDNPKCSDEGRNVAEQSAAGVDSASTPSLVSSTSNPTVDSLPGKKDSHSDVVKVVDDMKEGASKVSVEIIPTSKDSNSTSAVVPPEKDIASSVVDNGGDVDVVLKDSILDSTTTNDGAEDSKPVPVADVKEEEKKSEEASNAIASADNKTSEKPVGDSKEVSSAEKKLKDPSKPPNSIDKNTVKDSPKNGSKTTTKSPHTTNEKPNDGTTVKDTNGKVRTISPSDKTLWISSLSNKTRAADLKSLFSRYAKVSTAKILTNSKTPGARCYGLVTLVYSRDAASCIKNLHHTELHGRVISVERTRQDFKKKIVSASIKASVEKEKPKEEKDKEVKAPEPEKKIKKPSETPKSDKTKKESDKDSVPPNKRTRRSSRDCSRTTSSSSRSKDRARRSRSTERTRSRVPYTRKSGRFRSRSRSPVYLRSERIRDFQQQRSRFGDDFDRDRDLSKKNEEESLRLAQERHKLRLEREQLDRKRERLLLMEKEHQRIERMRLEQEMADIRKYSMILQMADQNDSKHLLGRSDLWDAGKHSRIHDSSLPSHSIRMDTERRDASRYYSADRKVDHPYNSGSAVVDHSRAPSSTWNTNPDHSHMGGPPVVPGVWARMDVPPPTPNQQWGTMNSSQQPDPLAHQPVSHVGMADSPVVMFVGNNSHGMDSNTPGQFPGNRYNSATRRF